jgi:hypothetical protein
MTPAPLQVGHAPSELALKSAGFTPLAFANAVRMGRVAHSGEGPRRRYDAGAAATRLTVPLRAINGDLYPTDVEVCVV